MKAFITFLLSFLILCSLPAQTYTIKSPDGKLTLTVETGEATTIQVALGDEVIIGNTRIGLAIDGREPLGNSPKVRKKKERAVNEVITPVVPNKSAKIADHFQELELVMKQDYSITFRVYDAGVAYRFETRFDGEVIVRDEWLELNLAGETTSFFPEEETLISHYERLYAKRPLSKISKDKFCSLPVLMRTKETYVWYSEADLYDYPNMFMHGTGQNGLKGRCAPYVTEATPEPGSEDRDQSVKMGDFLAKTKGTRTFPWRVFAITRDDKDLVANNMVFQLSRPLQIEDPSWIIPGKVAWDWYNVNNIYGVDFEAGINTQTYKYYIDFAAAYGLEYVILDEGWSKNTTEINAPDPEIDIEELVAYGRDKNVGIILWVLWGPLDKDFGVMKLYKDWGVKGIKVDFMQRADQYMVNYFERVAAEAARHNLLVDFHGSYKPAGLRRAYPNVLSYEGVKGNENNKWSKDISPEHNVTLPFTRMGAGPMDFTPGAMANATEENHRISFFRPASLGTRCHQVAMYVIYESPLQMLCDAPSTYYREEETARFIARIPSVWDETLILDARVADYILMARRKGSTWYLGAMTDWTGRELEVDLSFLEEGEYTIEVMKDGPNASRYAEDYTYESQEVSAGEKLTIQLAEGGGWAAILTKK